MFTNWAIFIIINCLKTRFKLISGHFIFFIFLLLLYKWKLFVALLFFWDFDGLLNESPGFFPIEVAWIIGVIFVPDFFNTCLKDLVHAWTVAIDAAEIPLVRIQFLFHVSFSFLLLNLNQLLLVLIYFVNWILKIWQGKL